MDKQAIEEYENKEKDKTQRFMKKANSKLDKGEKLSVTDFTPSLNRKLFTNYVLDEKLSIQLPFSRGLIVSVEPFKTPEMFHDHYGISADEIHELAINGVVFPVINCGLWRYVNIDYLDDIFELEPPTYLRLTGFFDLLSNHKYLKYFSKGEKIFRGKLANAAKRKQWDIMYPCGVEAYETKVCYDYARIKTLYPHLLKDISFKNKVKSADQIIHYDEVGVDPFTNAYEGLHRISFKRLKFHSLGSLVRTRVFRSDIARILVHSLRLEYPHDIGIDALKQIMKDPIVNKSQKAIADLDDAVQRRQSEVENERAKALQDVWKETCDALEALNHSISRVEKSTAYIAIAAVGIGSYYLTKDIASTIGISAATYPVLRSKLKVSAESIMKLRKPSHVSMLWSFRKEAMRIKKRVSS